MPDHAEQGHTRPTALLVRAAGTNCDTELARAFRLAGAQTRSVHIDRLLADPSTLRSADVIAFPGGFSYGDDIASGRIFAMHVRRTLAPILLEAVRRGARILGVCNGFQILVQAGLLPGWPDANHAAALVENQQARFVDAWVPVTYNNDSPCVWTRGLADDRDDRTAILPVANGEGRFVTSDEAAQRLEKSGQIALRYTNGFNGSTAAIAGICDPTGRVLGLMPHPERYLDWNRHPYWTALPPDARRGPTPGLRLFINAVDAQQPTPA